MDARDLIGRTIVGVRDITPEEEEAFYWCRGRGQTNPVLVLDNGVSLIPIVDEEMNGPGQFLAIGDQGSNSLIKPEGGRK